MGFGFKLALNRKFVHIFSVELFIVFFEDREKIKEDLLAAASDVDAHLCVGSWNFFEKFSGVSKIYAKF